ncbi:MAG: DeoR/GlpR transcriptional regulator [Clostridia bacterium]|nr:DeoR/GlpR transcriptional regulator [Clostridia bacterium]MBQ2669661.1 DeoR/GlpR transcriptional regulator [Clostridia bacterium]MBQ3472139.1 DeoR/GlpR transcriptional regulator [Clostridia bacterium]MBQ6531349.1 DeoR/GlpR transcriptional regulator [Clostridia bacterium]MBQ9598622.1 DeoR/GlpR transcriptional regulator [Clostridia bacterium]
MLPGERCEEILRIINERGSISNQELVALTGASESTIRRDITALADENRIMRVHGGAMSLNSGIRMEDKDVGARRAENGDEKRIIGMYAASLIENGDLVYIDAGTTTEYMIDYITAVGVTFVTNALTHAVRLAQRGFNAYILGGQVKSVTEAIIDSEAIISLSKYNFTKGFFGTNGVSLKRGFTTPDVREADVKKYAMSRCFEPYILCDASKFGKVSRVTFASGGDAAVITEKIPEGYGAFDIREAGKI